MQNLENWVIDFFFQVKNLDKNLIITCYILKWDRVKINIDFMESWNV